MLQVLASSLRAGCRLHSADNPFRPDDAIASLEYTASSSSDCSTLSLPRHSLLQPPRCAQLVLALLGQHHILLSLMALPQILPSMPAVNNCSSMKMACLAWDSAAAWSWRSDACQILLNLFGGSLAHSKWVLYLSARIAYHYDTAAADHRCICTLVQQA